jgi:hypothetical protein
VHSASGQLVSVIVKRHAARAVRAGVYPLLGAALLTPVAVLLGVPILTELTPERVLVLWVACLPASVLLAAMPLIRRLEVAALAELLDVDVPPQADRLYLAALTSLHLFGGATLSAGVLALSPELVRLGGLRHGTSDDSAEVLLAIAALLAAMVVMGIGQGWVARRLLRGEPSHVLDELGRRQALTLELHDSVGHVVHDVRVEPEVGSPADVHLEVAVSYGLHRTYLFPVGC